MKLVASILSNYYRLKYSLSTSKDREKILLHSTNLYMKARNHPLVLKQGRRFINDEELRGVLQFQAHKHKTKTPVAPQGANNPKRGNRPSLDFFNDNIALFLTYPE